MKFKFEVEVLINGFILNFYVGFRDKCTIKENSQAVQMSII